VEANPIVPTAATAIEMARVAVMGTTEIATDNNQMASLTTGTDLPTASSLRMVAIGTAGSLFPRELPYDVLTTSWCSI
jgi:hypothetical protein